MNVPPSPTLLVLAAGLSSRYGRLKQLEPLGPSGEAIMDYNVYDAIRAGFGSVTYVVRAEILDAVREHVASVFGDAVPASFVCQELDTLPDRFRAPPDRKKPWGTAHAVLIASAEWSSPVGVCNADDLYGAGAFALLHEYLESDPVPSEGVLVGYPLLETLSGSGGVARGICHLGREGFLEHVVEVREIRRRGAWIVGVEGDATPVELSGDELVSMNLWGFTPAILAGMRRRFVRFLELWGADSTREYYLSTAINDQVQAEGARVRVLHATDPWCGLTHAEDEGPSRTVLHERIAAGVYPTPLADGLRRSV